jgi:hypothetical protein
MDIQGSWEKALKNTEIIRPRVQPLATFAATHLPYVFLSESSLNPGDTVVRRGEVLVEKPALILPPHSPQFEGFEFEKEPRLNKDILVNFLLVRGVMFPSMKYDNKTYSLDIYEGRLQKAIEHYSDKLQREEDVLAGLVAGPEDCWQFSVLIFIFAQIVKSADGDIQKILEEFRRKRNL